MNSWKLFGAGATVAAFLTGMSFGQSCASPLSAGEGDTPVATTSGVTLDLTGFCDPGTFGDDKLYNVSWYAFVAPTTGAYTVQTCNTVDYDSRLAVLTNCNDASTVLACNDDGGAGCLISGTTFAFASKLTFNAEAGTTYYIAVGGFATADVGSGSMNIVAGSGGGGGGGGGGADCKAAAEVFDGPNDVDSSSGTASVDVTGFCDPGPFGDDLIHLAVWYKYTATETGNCEVSTCNSVPFDSRLGIFTSCDFSSVIACNDDGSGCANFSSKVQFAATAGETYYIALGGYDDFSSGSGVMVITPNAPPPDSCGNSAQDCCAAGSAPFCSDESCCSLVCAADSFCCDTQWDAICADEASQLCVVCGAGQCDLPSSTSTEAEACGDSVNGGCNGGTFETITLPAAVAGTFWADGGTRDTDWYEFTITEGTQVDISLYSKGPGVTYLLDNACPPAILAAPSGTGACPASVSMCLPAGTYRIFAGVTVFAGVPCGNPDGFNDYVLVVNGTPCDATAPANDECADAIMVPAAGGSEAFDSTFATTSGIPLDASCDEGFGTAFVKDLWYKWTPSESGLGKASTCNAATFDTRIAVYTDCDGTLVACNDDAAGCGLTSEATWAASAGTTYYVRVGGFSGGGTGTVTIGLQAAVVNDECEGATPVTNGSTPFDTTGATDSALPLDASCDEGLGLAMHKDIWFYYDATCSDTVTVSTCNTASYDTRLAVYTDCSGSIVACNDDGAGCGLTSTVSFSSTTGTRYYIRVGGFSGGGTGTLSIECGTGGGGLTNDTCATPSALTNGANSFTNVGAVSDAPTTSPSFCGTAGTGFYNDVWFTYTATTAGTATFSTCGTAPFDTRLELWSACPTGGGTVLACNDDGSGCSGFTSLMTYDLTCGTTYYVRVGAYGTTGFGAGTLTVTPGSTACSTPCPADLNGDGQVNGADIGLLLGNWGNAGIGDINNDGIVNGADIGALLGAWGACP